MNQSIARSVGSEVVKVFGQEWAALDQSAMPADEHQRLFDASFEIFLLDALPADAERFDLDCESGRWAVKVASKVARLHCIDPAPERLAQAFLIGADFWPVNRPRSSWATTSSTARV